MKTALILFTCVHGICAAPLFNGRDLAGWETYLAAPYGLNNDPQQVFSIVEADGAPAIRISGEIFGALTTLAPFTNFHLKLEFKWGDKRWPPRENALRDSGIFYCAQEPHGAASSAWMRSVQCNIMETGIGQWWSVGGTTVDVEGVRLSPQMESSVPYKRESKGEKVIVYTPDAPLLTADPSQCITPFFNNEKRHGEWNSVEVIFWKGICVHVLNGKVNMVLSNPRHAGKPLRSGRIQLQSEAAEIFYRNINMQSITELPREYQSLVPKS